MPFYRRAAACRPSPAFFSDTFVQAGRASRPQHPGLAQRSAATGARATYAGLKARLASSVSHAQWNTPPACGVSPPTDSPLLASQALPRSLGAHHMPGCARAVCLLKTFMKFSVLASFVAACALCLGNASFAHVVLQDSAAAAGSSYRAAFQVGHGCGDEATTAMRITLPAGFNGAQPMPKAGWTVSTKVGPLPVPYESHGQKYAQGVLEISWTANGPEHALPTAYYDEFVLRGTTPAKPGPLWFKVLQSCALGANDWAEVPPSGTSLKGLKSPAALLEVLDVQPAGAHAH